MTQIMTEATALILALLAGILLGVVFFGGLWWTIQKGISSTQPAFWFLGSLLVRTAIAVTGFYFVSHGEWRKVLACLLGFLIARIASFRFTRAPLDNGSRITDGGRT